MFIECGGRGGGGGGREGGTRDGQESDEEDIEGMAVRERIQNIHEADHEMDVLLLELMSEKRVRVNKLFNLLLFGYQRKYSHIVNLITCINFFFLCILF